MPSILGPSTQTSAGSPTTGISQYTKSLVVLAFMVYVMVMSRYVSLVLTNNTRTIYQWIPCSPVDPRQPQWSPGSHTFFFFVFGDDGFGDRFLESLSERR